MGCDGFFVDRRDLMEKRKDALVLRAHWATPENGKRLMDLWKIARRWNDFDRREFDWGILSKLADACMISNDIVPADLSGMGCITNELPLTIEDMLEQADYRTLVVLDWATRSAQEYRGMTIEEIFYSEGEQ